MKAMKVYLVMWVGDHDGSVSKIFATAELAAEWMAQGYRADDHEIEEWEVLESVPPMTEPELSYSFAGPLLGRGATVGILGDPEHPVPIGIETIG
jgi:hypothetical protein